MTRHSLFSGYCHPPVARRAATALIMLVALAWTSPAFCDKIHDAAGNGDLGKVKALLKDNPDLVFSKDKSGRTPLDWAAASGHKEVVELLLANKANVNANDNHGVTPLHMAAGNGHKDVAEALLANKADVNARDNYGWTPLGEASLKSHKEKKGRKDVAELLRQHGGHK